MPNNEHIVVNVAADHAGLAHKDAVRAWLRGEGITVTDHGPLALEPTDDYPDYIGPAAAAVSADPMRQRAIVFGGSGQGEAMAANRFPYVRAAVFYGGPDEIVRLSREHNDANVLSIGARFVDIDTCKRLIWEWLHTAPRSEEKYARRNRKLEQLAPLRK